MNHLSYEKIKTNNKIVVFWSNTIIKNKKEMIEELNAKIRWGKGATWAAEKGGGKWVGGHLFVK